MSEFFKKTKELRDMIEKQEAQIRAVSSNVLCFKDDVANMDYRNTMMIKRYIDEMIKVLNG